MATISLVMRHDEGTALAKQLKGDGHLVVHTEALRTAVRWSLEIRTDLIVVSGDAPDPLPDIPALIARYSRLLVVDATVPMRWLLPSIRDELHAIDR